MARRKTLYVEQLKDQVNDILAASVVSADERRGMLKILEHVLHETGNYRGFRYLVLKEVPLGQKPGLVIDEHGSRWVNTLDTDNTRVEYY